MYIKKKRRKEKKNVEIDLVFALLMVTTCLHGDVGDWKIARICLCRLGYLAVVNSDTLHYVLVSCCDVVRIVSGVMRGVVGICTYGEEYPTARPL